MIPLRHARRLGQRAADGCSRRAVAPSPASSHRQPPWLPVPRLPHAAGGWYADAWNGGAGEPPAWETFHLVELIELLDRNWRADGARPVAGVSMGGFGAMAYAARHPGMFRAAASSMSDTHGGTRGPAPAGRTMSPPHGGTPGPAWTTGGRC